MAHSRQLWTLKARIYYTRDLAIQGAIVVSVASTHELKHRGLFPGYQYSRYIHLSHFLLLLLYYMFQILPINFIPRQIPVHRRVCNCRFVSLFILFQARYSPWTAPVHDALSYKTVIPDHNAWKNTLYTSHPSPESDAAWKELQIGAPSYTAQPPFPFESLTILQSAASG